MLDEKGWEVPDPTPLARAVRFQRPPTLQEQIRAMIRTHLSSQAQSQGLETWEEANDFEVGDDYDPSSPWELKDDHEETYQRDLSEWRERQAALNVRGSAKQKGGSDNRSSSAEDVAGKVAGSASGKDRANVASERGNDEGRSDS